MSKSRGKTIPSPDDGLFAPRRRKPIPHQFVLDALAELSPLTRPMFGCTAIYVKEKIVLILRDKPASTDNGVWLATTAEHHESLRRDFPAMRSIDVLGKGGVTGWQLLAADAPDFETSALHACELVIAGDPRIGKVPAVKRKRAQGTKTRRFPG